MVLIIIPKLSGWNFFASLLSLLFSYLSDIFLDIPIYVASGTRTNKLPGIEISVVTPVSYTHLRAHET